MKKLLILGAGTAGTTTANRMVRRLPPDWSITVVDPEPLHLYQPGLLFLPFGAQDEDKMLRPRKNTLSPRVTWINTAIAGVDTERHRIDLADGRALPYDKLIVATGSQIRPELTEGLSEALEEPNAFEFYTLEGAIALRAALERFEGGRLAVNVVEMPIKCPVAPLEFLFLADDFFRRRGTRERVELTYVVPLDAVFTKPLAAKRLGHLLADKGIDVVTEFATGTVNGDTNTLISWDEREVAYDLLVSVPTHSGAEFISSSGLGDELNFVPTDMHTLEAKGLPDVFVLGDATDLPSSKAGSVAHFQSELLEENLMRSINGQTLEPSFDGHANCFVETGNNKAMLIDFNYEVEPLPGHYPLPGIGPFSLMKESWANHQGKLAFRWMYWNGLLPARPMPVPAKMSKLGKRLDLLDAA